MRTNRRSFLRGAIAAASAASAARLDAGQQHVHPSPPAAPATPSRETLPPRSLPGVSRVETPDLPTLGWQMSGGVKEFHLTAAPVRTEFMTGRPVDAWGFNGLMPGPTIEITQGDRVRIVVKNGLPEPFSMHWHGLEVPIDMDGTPGISQEAIPPGGSFTYEFTIDQHGTFFYHSHMAMQELMGLIGLFIVQPRVADMPRIDRDFGLIWQGWSLLPNNTIPNTMAMEFNWLTINGKSGPATTPLIVRRGERVRIRNVNLSMDHHPLHLHGNTFHVTGTEAGRIPQSAWVPGNTVLVGVAQARDIEFVASREGDWMLHCHLPHHMVNNMVAMAGPMMHGPSPTPPRPPGRFGEPDPTLVPGFPQDMTMDMTEMPAKPELHGLPNGWTAGMMGMMTLVRVLSPEMFGHIDAMRAAARGRA
jgi:FtsP/CotA-like multicopper oxidase with cupredoxin domain